MYSSISANKRNTVIIFSVFILILAGIGLSFSYIYNDYSIFVITLISALIYAWVDYAFSTKIAISMSGAQEIKREQSPEFYSAVETMSITAGLPMPKIYIIEDSAPNAFAAGTNPDNAIICATTGLLEIMNKAELEGVVAHEISHIKNYDIRVSMAAIALTAAIGFIADIAIRIIFYDRKERSNNPIVLVVGLLFAILSPVLAIIVRLAISREREYLADATAVSLTRYPDGLISALEKLKDNSRPMQKQNSTTASLFITNPLKEGFTQKLFSTHPSLNNRIRRLKDNSARF